MVHYAFKAPTQSRGKPFLRTHHRGFRDNAATPVAAHSLWPHCVAREIRKLIRVALPDYPLSMIPRRYMAAPAC